VLGTLAGKQLNQRLNQRWLKRGFALFLLLMAGYMLCREMPRLSPASATEAAMMDDGFRRRTPQFPLHWDTNLMRGEDQNPTCC
jgi:hypothetical protein